MIQRIQSLYLSLTIILTLIFLKGSFLTFIDKSGSVIKVTLKGLMKVTSGPVFEILEKLLPLSALIICIPTLALAALLLYKNRKIQKWFTLAIIIIASGLIMILGYYSLNICSNYNASLLFNFKMVIPVIILVFAILAYRGIRKDDLLIKSYDRLR